MSDQSGPVRKRRRPAFSCIQCRRRKIKCDRNVPCNHCTISHYTCTYDHKYRREEPNTSIPTNIASTSNNPGQDQWRPQAAAAEGGRTQFPTPGPSPKPGILSDPFHQQQLSAPEQTVSQLTEHIKTLEQKVAELSSAQPVESIYVPRSKPREARGILSKSLFYGPGHWVSSLEQFDKLRAFTHNTDWNDTSSFKQAHSNADLYQLVSRCKALAKVLKSQRPICIIPEAELNDTVPPRPIAEKLIDLYLQNFESAHRILHIPTFRRECIQYWEQSEGKPPAIAFLIKLVLVLAIGSSMYEDPDMDAQLHYMAHNWIHTAQSWLSGPFEKSRINLTGIQINCLLLLARQATSTAGDFVWISAGSLLRMAMQTGMHLDPKHFPKISIFHAELRRRLWATIVELAAQASLDSGMPAMISTSDYDTEEPLNIDDSEIDENTKVLPTPKPLTTFTQTSLQILLLKSLPIRLEIAKTTNDFRSDPSYDSVLQLSSQLTKFCRESSIIWQSYRTSSPGQTAAPKSFHKNILDLFQYRFILVLHRPFANKARTDPRFYFSRKICLDAAVVVISAEEDKEFYRLSLVGGGLFKEIMRNGTVSLTLELINQVEEDSQGISLHQNKQNRAPLLQLLRNMLVMQEKRIQIHENNVKGHLFLAMSLAQIEAMEAGIAPETTFASSARASLTTCYDLLKSRATPGTEDIELPQPAADGNDNNLPENADLLNMMEYDFLGEDGLNNFLVPDSWLLQGWDENTGV